MYFSNSTSWTAITKYLAELPTPELNFTQQQLFQFHSRILLYKNSSRYVAFPLFGNYKEKFSLSSLGGYMNVYMSISSIFFPKPRRQNNLVKESVFMQQWNLVGKFIKTCLTYVGITWWLVAWCFMELKRHPSLEAKKQE